jgi:hypothetical protein
MRTAEFEMFELSKVYYIFFLELFFQTMCRSRYQKNKNKRKKRKKLCAEHKFQQFIFLLGHGSP